MSLSSSLSVTAVSSAPLPCAGVSARRAAAWLALVWGGLAAGLAADPGDHWSYQPLHQPELPANHAARHPVDAFVFARLEAEGLSPSPQADPGTLLRRLSLDLTGLLPAPEEAAAFLQAWSEDPGRAWSAEVERLLASPHFGEQWGRHWLDLARFADSDGYLGDSHRNWAWVYRDWVVEAVNRDLPHDQFSIEQLAGDLLPGAGVEQRVATGFHRNTLRNTEAGVDLELYRTKEVVDRVAATGTVWLGLTLACAECHDHKHDAVTQKEFFQLYSFFNNADEVDIGAPRPGDAERYEQARLAWEERMQAREAALAGWEESKLEARLAAWETALPEARGAWTTLAPESAKSGASDTMEIREDGSIHVTGKDPATATYTVVTRPAERPSRIGALRLEAIGDLGRGREPARPSGRGKDGGFSLSSLSAKWIPEDSAGGEAKPVALRFASARADHAEGGQDLARVLDGKSETGWQVGGDAALSPRALELVLAGPVDLPAGARLEVSLLHKHESLPGATLRHFRLSAAPAASPGEVTSLPAGIAAILERPSAERSGEESAALRDFYLDLDPEWKRLRAAVAGELAQAPARPATKAMAFAERTKEPRESYLHVRGDYLRVGETVSPGGLATLPPITAREGEKADRLDLARWLFGEAHPLVPRVSANQVWQHLFGQGLVETPDDFGTEGARPSHPELLDWLAAEYRRLGWSRKELIRLIVSSETYRQSSAMRPELADFPGGNALLWRQNSFRVGAETVRDIHLAASGLLDPSFGGPGIRPPLPEFVTEVGRSVQWPVSEGGDRYRRGLYIFLKRTVLYPMLTVFDAPDTSVSCSRRERSNSPMQALTLLNDPVFFECAEELGKELLVRHGKDAESAIRELFLRCFSREPREEELHVMLSAHGDLERAAGDPGLALAATARVVMNLDEFVTRD